MVTQYQENRYMQSNAMEYEQRGRYSSVIIAAAEQTKGMAFLCRDDPTSEHAPFVPWEQNPKTCHQVYLMVRSLTSKISLELGGMSGGAPLLP